nr:hypothetical protein [Tanacetum cinerariifolium]
PGPEYRLRHLPHQLRPGPLRPRLSPHHRAHRCQGRRHGPGARPRAAHRQRRFAPGRQGIYASGGGPESNRRPTGAGSEPPGRFEWLGTGPGRGRYFVGLGQRRACCQPPGRPGPRHVPGPHHPRERAAEPGIALPHAGRPAGVQ